MKIIIAGSRHLTDLRFVAYAVNRSPFKDKITEVVSGRCRGIDSLGERWANGNFIPVKFFDAEWTKNGKAAGPIRNAAMAIYASGLIAIPHPNERSTGTWDMINKMKEANKPVFIYNVNNDFMVSKIGPSTFFMKK